MAICWQTLKTVPLFEKKGEAFLNFLEITYEIKKGMLFCLSHRDKRVEITNLLHFLVSTSKNFPILELPEPCTYFFPVIWAYLPFVLFEHHTRILFLSVRRCYNLPSLSDQHTTEIAKIVKFQWYNPASNIFQTVMFRFIAELEYNW